MTVHLPSQIGRWFNRLSPMQAMLFGYGFLLLLALIDYSSDITISFSVFFLIPVLVVGGRASLRAATLMSFISATLWEAINRRDIGVSISLGIHLWNLGTRSLTGWR